MNSKSQTLAKSQKKKTFSSKLGHAIKKKKKIKASKKAMKKIDKEIANARTHTHVQNFPNIFKTIPRQPLKFPVVDHGRHLPTHPNNPNSSTP